MGGQIVLKMLVWLEWLLIPFYRFSFVFLCRAKYSSKNDRLFSYIGTNYTEVPLDGVGIQFTNIQGVKEDTRGGKVFQTIILNKV